jgi:large subunit ribosomal protein L31
VKANIHPQYYSDAKVTCACGNTFTVGSTKPTIHVDLCHKCHPFYTGVQKFADTEGNIQKFEKKQKVAAAKQAVIKVRKEEKAKEEFRPKTLREMLLAQQ